MDGQRQLKHAKLFLLTIKIKLIKQPYLILLSKYKLISSR